MNEHGRDDHAQSYTSRYPDALTDRALGERIARHFEEQADEIHFTPELREIFMSRLPSRQQQRPSVYMIAAFACAAVLVLALTLNEYFTQITRPLAQQVQYTSLQELRVSPELANGGQAFSVDPTEQRLVYEAANQNGVFYTARLQDPLNSNMLAMRYARDMAWSPDGSAIVATVSPEGSFLPLLALVPSGQYMHLIGHDALAATWSPKDKQLITYVQQDHGQTQLWSITADGKANTLVTTMQLPLLVKHMLWSPDGRYLALAVSSTTSPTPATLDQPAHTIYVVDMQTNAMQNFTLRANSHVGAIEWSPDGKKLAYEEVDSANKSTLQVVTITKATDRFAITPQHSLQGWSWSPDSKALVYSDGGTLRIYGSYGKTIQFSQNRQQLTSPYWLKNGNIVCLRVDQGLRTLQFLGPKTK